MEKVFTQSINFALKLFSFSEKFSFFLVLLKSRLKLAVKLVGGFMKTLIPVRQLIITSLVLATYTSCNKVNFTEVPQELQTSLSLPPPAGEPPVGPVTPPPVDPITPVIPPEEPPPKIAKLSQGNCAADSSTQLLSCMNCPVPMNPPAPPQLSQKGEALLNIMTLSCETAVKPYNQNYVGPTREQLLARLNRASPSLYPDSTMTSQQRNVVTQLQSLTSDSMRESVFGSLWYSANGLAFETYFGLSISESIYTFCGQVGNPTFDMNNTIPLRSKAYTDCLNEASPWTTCTESTTYVTANTFRNQLKNSMRQSISNPYVAPAPLPEKNCQWEKFEGDDTAIAQQKINDWQAAGFTVGMSIESGDGVGYCGSLLPDSLVNRTLTISAYRCQ